MLSVSYVADLWLFQHGSICDTNDGIEWKNVDILMNGIIRNRDFRF